MTTPATNRRLLTILNAVYFSFAVAILVDTGKFLDDHEIKTLFPRGHELAVGAVTLSVLMMAASILGVYSIRHRNECITLFYIFINSIILGCLIGIGFYTLENSHRGSISKIAPDLKDGWVELAAEALDSQRVLKWIQTVQTAGNCCGWDDIDDIYQNPAWLDCPGSLVGVATCDAFVQRRLTSMARPVAELIIILCSIQAFLLCISCGFVCRLRKNYQVKVVDDFGDVEDPDNRLFELRAKAEVNDTPSLFRSRLLKLFE